MCAILDANVVGRVFGAERPAAAQAFFEWIDSGRGRLVLGARLRRELDRNGEFQRRRRQTVLAGRVTLLKDQAVDDRAQLLGMVGQVPVRRPHVVAVAQLSGARLLFERRRSARRFQGFFGRGRG